MGKKIYNKKNEPDDELFIPDVKINLMFVHNFPFINNNNSLYVIIGLLYIFSKINIVRKISK